MADIFDRLASTYKEEDIFDRLAKKDAAGLSAEEEDIFDRLAKKDAAGLSAEEEPEKPGLVNGKKKGFVGRVKESWETGKLQTELGQLRYQQLIGNDSEEIKNRISEIKPQAEKTPTPSKNIIEKGVRAAAEMIPIQVSGLKKGFARGSALGAGAAGMALLAGQAGPQVALPEEAVTVPAAAAGMFTVGMTSGSLENIGQIEAGLAYDELLNLKDENGKTLDPTIAKGAAVGVGVINSLLEVAQIKTLLKTVPGGDKVFRKAVNETAKKVVTSQSLKKLALKYAGKYAGAVATETAQEIAQESTNIVADELSKKLNNELKGTDLPEATKTEIVNRLKETAVDSALAFSLMVMPGTVVSGGKEAIEQKKVNQVEAQKTTILNGIRKDYSNKAITRDTVNQIKERLPNLSQDIDTIINEIDAANIEKNAVDIVAEKDPEIKAQKQAELEATKEEMVNSALEEAKKETKIVPEEEVAPAEEAINLVDIQSVGPGMTQLANKSAEESAQGIEKEMGRSEQINKSIIGKTKLLEKLQSEQDFLGPEEEPVSYEEEKGFKITQTRKTKKDANTLWKVTLLNDGLKNGLRGMKDEVGYGEPGKRMRDEDGNFFGVQSSYPDWMQDRGWTKVEVQKSIDAVLAGKDLGIKQTAIVEAAIDELNKREYNDSRKDLLDEYTEDEIRNAEREADEYFNLQTESHSLTSEELTELFSEKPARQQEVTGEPHAVFKGYQESTKEPYLIPIFNIVGGSRNNSTVTAVTLEKEGIAIPEHAQPSQEDIQAVKDKFDNLRKKKDETPTYSKTLQSKGEKGKVIPMTEKRGKADISTNKTQAASGVIDTLNPTGKIFTDYTPQQRMTMKLGENITTLDKTMDKSPDEEIPVYRGSSSNQQEIIGGDFVTTNKQLAKDYAGNDKVIEKKVKLSDILDDKTEPLGEEYIYWPLQKSPKAEGEKDNSLPNQTRSPEEGGQPVYAQKSPYLTESGNPITVQAVQKIVNQIKTRLPNIGNIVVFDKQSDIPDELHERAGENPQDYKTGKNKVYGMYDPKTDTIYIIAENMKTRNAVINLILHEAIGHRGVNAILKGEERKRVFKWIKNAYTDTDIGKGIISDYGLDLSIEADQNTFSKELIAHMAQTGENATIFDRIIAWVKRAIRRAGFNLKISDVEIRELLSRSYEYAQTGKRPAMDLGQAMYQVEAFHGSPYVFDRFSTDKIGTGEGAQSFGYGLYFTDKDEIARHYADGLGKGEIIINGKKWQQASNNLKQDVDNWMKSGNEDYIKNMVDLSIKNNERAIGKNYYTIQMGHDLDTLTEIKRELEKGTFYENVKYKPNSRNLYKVTLHKGKTPDQYTWLDWDKPIINAFDKPMYNEEMPGIWGKIARQAKKEGVKLPFVQYPTGEYLYGDLVEKFSEKDMGDNYIDGLTESQNAKREASLFLLRAGIDGIRYHSGTLSGIKDSEAFNYVVFDENAVTIDDRISYSKSSYAEADAWLKNVLNETETIKNEKEEFKKINDESIETLEKIKGFATFKQGKEDLKWWDSIIGTPLHYFSKIPGMKRMFRDANKKTDNIEEMLNRMTLSPDGKNHDTKIIEAVKKSDAKGYAKMQESLVEDDRNQRGYRVIQSVDDQGKTGYAVYEPGEAKIMQTWSSYRDAVAAMQKIAANKKIDPQLIRYTYNDDAKKWYGWLPKNTKQIAVFKDEEAAWADVRQRQAQDFQDKYGISDDVKQAYLAFKRIADRGFYVQIQDIRNQIAWRASRGLEMPKVVEVVNGESITVDLKAALAMMGDRRGYYFPRNRNQGKYELRAEQKGKTPYLQYFDAFIEPDKSGNYNVAKLAVNKAMPVGKTVRDLLKKGYSVKNITIEKANRTLEDIFVEGANRIINMQAEINDALKATDTKPLSLEKLGLKFIDRRVSVHGTMQRDFAVYGPLNKEQRKILKELGGQYYSPTTGEPQGWHFINPGRYFEKRLAKALVSVSHVVDQEAMTTFAQAFMENLSDIEKGRGARSHMIARSNKRGEGVYRGYEEDPLLAISTYAAGIAGAEAKKVMALDLIRDFNGTDISFRQFKVIKGYDGSFEDYITDFKAVQMFDGDFKGYKDYYSETKLDEEDYEALKSADDAEIERTDFDNVNDPEALGEIIDKITELQNKSKTSKLTEEERKDLTEALTWMYNEYQNLVSDRRIDEGGKGTGQPNAWRDGKSYITNMLRNDEQLDRILGTIKGIAVFKFLAGRVSAPVVNLTALATTVPAAMNVYADIPMTAAARYLTVAGQKYISYKIGKTENISEDSLWALDQIKNKKWDSSKFNKEALSALESKVGRKWDKLLEWGMIGFGATEALNRGSTILGAYNAIRASKPNLTRDEALKLAKEVSDKAHSVYNKANWPKWVRGAGIAPNIARSFYVFKSFSHNYLQLMKDAYGPGVLRIPENGKALAWLAVSPAILAGTGAMVGKELLFALLKAFGVGGDDPEEEFYAWIAKQFGERPESIARYGMAGAVGLNLKGSLAIGMTDLDLSLTGILGAPGEMLITEPVEMIKALKRGNISKALENAPFMPLALANPLKGIREATQGVTTKTNTPVFYGKEQIMADKSDVIARFFSFSPADISQKREKQYAESAVEERYTSMRTDIYARIKSYYSKDTRSDREYRNLLEDIREYNERLKNSNVINKIYITKKSIRTNLRRSYRASKKERLRQE